MSLKQLSLDLKKLTITYFDDLEDNVSDTLRKEEYFFVSSGGLYAHGNCNNFLQEKKYTPYLGHDGEIYPKFKLKQIYIEVE